MSDTCQPCQIIICEPVPPTPSGNFYGNATVYWQCPELDTITLHAPLPSWITLDSENNQLIGLAGVYRSTSKTAANALAQEALDGWANQALESGDLTCSNDTCPPVEFTPQYFTGDLNAGNSYTQDFTFTGITGVSVSCYVYTLVGHYNPIVSLYDPLMNLVDSNSGNFSNGFYPDAAWSSAAVTSTLTMNGIWTVRITDANAPTGGTFNLSISGGIDGVINGMESAWVGCYVTSTKRIFILRGFDGTECHATCLNANDNSIVNDVLLSTTSGAFAPARPIIFYNVNDNSVWAGAMDNGETFAHYFRLDPATGAVIEDIPLLAGQSAAYLGAFVPSNNCIYGGPINFSPSSSFCNVFDCTSRTYIASIPFGSSKNTPVFQYIPEIDRVLVKTYSATPGYFLINPNDNSIISYTTKIAGGDYLGFYNSADGLYYCTGNTKDFIALDLLADTIVHQTSNSSYHDWNVAYNPVTNRMLYHDDNGGFNRPYFVVSLELDDFLQKDNTVVAITSDPNDPEHAFFIWNPVLCRMYYSFSDGNIYILDI